MVADVKKQFLDGIKSPFTKRNYSAAISTYMRYHKMKRWSRLLSKDVKDIQSKIQEFIVHQRDVKGLRASTIDQQISALWHFYTYNDVTAINWVRLRSYAGEHIKAVKDKPYTLDQIRTMLDHSSTRLKVAILLMCSAGLRVGAIPELRLKHLHRIDDLKNYSIVVYENTASEYWTYCSYECAMFIDQYLSDRKRAGEELGGETPLIREQYDNRDIQQVKNPRQIKRNTIVQLMHDMLVESGLRKPIKGASDLGRRTRHENAINHSLRKFFKSQLRKASVDALLIEYLMGHKSGNVKEGVTRLMATYDPADNTELMRAYAEGMDNLIIFSANKLKLENEELRRKLSEAPTVEQLQADLQKEREERKQLYQQLYAQGIIKNES